MTVVSAKEPAGKPLSAMTKLTVVVTVDGGLDDLAVLRQHGAANLRQLRVLRMTEEAMDQGGVLTQEDLARLLQTGVRTIRRDIAQLRAEGHWVPTRGVVQDTGRGQSHKAKIVEMYLRRMTYSQIADARAPQCRGDQALRADVWPGAGGAGEGTDGSRRDRVCGGGE